MLPVWTQTNSGEWVPQYRVWWVDAKTAAHPSSSSSAAAPATPAAAAGLLSPAVAGSDEVVSPAAVSHYQQRTIMRADQQHSHVSPNARPFSVMRATSHSRNSNSGGGSSSNSSSGAVAALVNGVGAVALSCSSSRQAQAASLTKKTWDDTSSQLKRDQVQLTKD
jgi:hypothetical protein